MTPEPMQAAGRQIQRDDAAAHAIVHHEVDGEVFDEELGLVCQRLLVQRMQHRVPGSVGRGASALRGALAKTGGHTAERPLVDATVVGA